MEELIEVLNKNNIKYDEKKLYKVYEYVKVCYVDEVKYNKQKKITHVIETAMLVATLKLNENSIYASLLHELEDTKDIEKKFGKDVLDLVNGIRRVSYLNYSRKNIDANIMKKMFISIAKDIRVIVIKLCDRLATMRKYKDMKEDIKLLKAKESLEIYTSIANRLGMSNIKSELEDISFLCLYPDEYQYIKEKIDNKKNERKKYVDDKIKEIEKILNSENIEYKIYGRPKHFYSIHKKMKEKNYDVDDIFDLIAIRVILKSVKDCYTTLGLIHSLYKPMPGRFKDYIAVPKVNGYKSLHTTLFGDDNNTFEVQIRTEDMHVFAEYGAAAHFMYKEKESNIEDKILWIRQTLQFAKESINKDSIKGEIFGEEVFVFTPNGDIKALKKGATVIDFAYNVHQKVAESMVGCKINGVAKPIFTKVKNTDVIEILTSNNAKGPTMDWLKHVKTTSTKNKITSFLKKQGFEENVARGKLLFEKEVKKQKESKEELLQDKYMLEMIDSLDSKNLDHLYENIGFGNISPTKTINRLLTVYYKYNEKIEEVKDISSIKKTKRESDYILVENLSGCLVKLARCCSPIPGDEIIGYITNSNGVTVHRKDCNNVRVGMKTINVKWKKLDKNIFNTNIKIMANDREGITVEIINKLNELKVNLTSIKVNVTAQKLLSINLNINVESIDKLNKVIREIKKIDSIFEVKRKR